MRQLSTKKQWAGAESWQASATIQDALVEVMRKEADAIVAIINQFPSNAWQLVDRILHTSGKVIFSGMGKSGLIAQKLAATCSSLGLPSFFLHPSDALHGDLGAVQGQDLFIALSKSATGEEFDYIFPVLKSRRVGTCLICCSQGKLVEKADLVVALPIQSEACSLNLAPTTSSTLMMAFGDALAVVTSSLKGFGRHEFACNHPAGALGKRLLLTVRSMMHQSASLPLLMPTTAFKDLLVTITTKKLGLGIVVDARMALEGIVTDGDLRRACELGPEVFNKTAIEIATIHPKFISPDILAYAALQMMEDFNITSLVVVEKQQVVGLVHIHDLIKAGIRE